MNAIQGIYTIGNEVYKIGKNCKGLRGIEKSQVFLRKQKIDNMKKIMMALLMIFSFYTATAQDSTALKLDPSKKILLVDASCGQCQFNMKGKGCTLAVKIKGKAYFVEKAHIDAFGDAHDTDGFCSAIRKAKVQGKVVGDKFVASYFELLPPSIK